MPVAKYRLADRRARDSFDLWQVRRQFKQLGSLLRAQAARGSCASTDWPQAVPVDARSRSTPCRLAARRGASCTVFLTSGRRLLSHPLHSRYDGRSWLRFADVLHLGARREMN